MKKRVIFPVLAFVMAAGSVFATSMFAPVPGHSQIADVPNQGVDCEARKQCDDQNNTNVLCRASFVEGGIQYTNIQLYKLEANGTCPTQVWELP